MPPGGAPDVDEARSSQEDEAPAARRPAPSKVRAREFWNVAT